MKKKILIVGGTGFIGQQLIKACLKLKMDITWKGQKLRETGYYLNKPIIEIDPKYLRPTEVESLKGNAEKAKLELNWKPKFNIHTLIDDMISKMV